MFVMSTAGHIDHGKSVLVRALTGIDPDRLQEEKERGMTIDLGFAWMKTPGGREIGIVDVPGHEKFIGNMLAGVGGVDLTLLVIAANEGVMPQTREHVAILDLLEIKKGVVAVTKTDLVDQEWLDLIKIDIEELLKPTTLKDSPIIPVSVIAEKGLTELKEAIDRQLESTEPKKDIGRPRLPIDRIFTIPGAGTVVTGTLIDGSFRTGQDVEIVPKGVKSRIHGLQTHKTKTDIAIPGSRVAANLVGINVTDLERGNVVSRPGTMTATSLVSAKLRLLQYLKHPLRHFSEVSLFTGAAVSLAKVRILESDELQPGASGWVQFVLQDPLVAVAGDHFVIRSTTETLGGGRIINPRTGILRRRRPELIKELQTSEEGTPEDKIFSLIQAKQPLEIAALLKSDEITAGETEKALNSLLSQGRAVEAGSGERRYILTGPGWDNIARRTAEYVGEYHKKYPLRPGMPKEELRTRLKFTAAQSSIIMKLIEDKVITEKNNDVALPSYQIKLTPAQEAEANKFIGALESNPYAPSVAVMPEPELLNYLVQQKRVTKVTSDVIFAAAAYKDMESRVVEYIKTHGKITLAEARDMFKTSRKYAQALLEYMDGKKVTRRVGDDRVLLS